MVSCFKRFCLLLALVGGGGVQAQIVVPPGGSYDVPAGAAMNLGCTGIDNQGTFKLNAGQVSGVSHVAIAATGTLNGSGSLSVSGNWSNSGSFVAGTGSVTFTDGCAPGAGEIKITGNTVFNNLTLSSNRGQMFKLGGSITVNGTLTLQGTSGQPVQLQAESGQPVLIQLGAGAKVAQSFATLQGGVQIGNLGPPQNHQAIPGLDAAGLLLLSLGLAAVALWRGRQQVSDQDPHF